VENSSPIDQHIELTEPGLKEEGLVKRCERGNVVIGGGEVQEGRGDSTRTKNMYFICINSFNLLRKPALPQPTQLCPNQHNVFRRGTSISSSPNQSSNLIN
jgi:hypothetical protein